MDEKTIQSLPWYAIITSTAVAGTFAGIIFHYELFIVFLFGALIGYPTLLGGALVHTVATLLFLTVFAYLFRNSRFAPFTRSWLRVLLFGVGYSVVLFVLVFGVILPLGTRVANVESLPLPYWPIDGFGAHLLFGLLVGVIFALLARRPSVHDRS